MVSRSRSLTLAVVAAVALLLGSADSLVGQDPVAARDLRRGATLTAADIAGDPSGLIGWVTRRVVTAGESLRAPAVAPPEVVRSGDDVQLVWSDGSLVLRMAGRAMNSAAVGERVMVRIDTQRRFEGIAQAPGEVRLASPATK